MAGPYGNRFQPRTIMNMGGSREAAMRAFLQRKELKELEEEQAAMNTVVVEAFRDPPVLPEEERKKQLLMQQMEQRQRARSGSLLRQQGAYAGTPKVTSSWDNLFVPNVKGGVNLNSPFDRGPTEARQVDEFSESNIPFFTGTGIGGAVANRSLKTPPSAPAAPIIPVGARARHHPGFDQYAYAGKPNRANPFSSELLADLRKPEEDEFMSWDNKMFLLSLLAGMQGGKPPTPYGTAVGGGNKAWAPLPFGRMA